MIIASPNRRDAMTLIEKLFPIRNSRELGFYFRTVYHLKRLHVVPVRLLWFNPAAAHADLP